MGGLAQEDKKSWSKFAKPIFLAVVCVVIILPISVLPWAVQAFKIPTNSMKPALLIGDHFLINKVSYDIRLPSSHKVLFHLGDPLRGDIIVFHHPEHRGKNFVKRIMGLPGETIDISNKQVFINGKKIKDPWGYNSDRSSNSLAIRPLGDFGPVSIPPDQYFVMGDNRDESLDSRFWFGGRGGYVPRRDILGRAFIIYWAWEDHAYGVRWSRIGSVIN